ncbi:hypothetical protein BKA93DRAFT_799943 [Sparassis latifolia]|uniref:RRM domain-containing protein n=1 Tax=Sparassis crispa TaxID=139825 RepID=A0A401H500_9APHY|nr:hypothetical protein SCP_1601700 [Sparassis crispa]GBE89508.1 hypothetical protein SCP_1601700 [Sparassis crispa]
MDEPIVKRLHVSGLTPAITPADLTQRLSSFGAVKAVDGFGVLDAVGLPRKFGYVTLETTKPKLARCMNTLSGVTWKGTKLRIGEAKLDFRERILKENETLKRAASDSPAGPPHKRRRLPRGVHGVHAQDMSLVTPGNAASRPGWRVTSLGRLIRPIRMRPEHPLPDQLPKIVSAEKGRKPQKERTQKKRVKNPPTRARRRTIDPTKWGSLHLKGVFLDTGATLDVGQRPPALRETERGLEESSNDEESDDDDDETDSGDEVMGAEEYPPSLLQEATLSPPFSPKPAAQKTRANVGDENDLVQETKKSLGLLQVLFGGRGDDEWGDQESVDSDGDLDDHARPADMQAEDIEENHMHVDKAVSFRVERVQPHEELPTPVSAQSAKLKDLFAPREEDAGFSLLGHLDLDLELDDEVDLQLTAEPQARPVPQPVATVSPAAGAQSVFDTRRPLFFPFPLDERDRARGRTGDAFDATNWRTWFYRTDSAEEIHKRWEETRGELTSGWKRRHREAVKSRRRRGGGAEDGDA